MVTWQWVRPVRASVRSRKSYDASCDAWYQAWYDAVRILVRIGLVNRDRAVAHVDEWWQV
jgi:hypothetical protein